MDDASFTYLFRVRYGECDAQNVVFNARYADYLDLAATEFLRAIGMDYKTLLQRGLDNQVVKLTLEWRSPARFDDVLAARVETSHLGATSYTLSVSFVHHESGRDVASAEAVYVMVDARSWQKTPLPDDVRARLADNAPGAVIDHAGVLADPSPG